MSNGYRQVECAAHVSLTRHITAGQIVEVVFRDESGQVQTVHDVIRDLFLRAGEEFLLLGRGQLVRLDHVFLVNGEPMAGVRST